MMKFVLYHDPKSKEFTLPRAALELSGLDDAEEMDLRLNDGCILLVRKDLTAEEALGTIHLLQMAGKTLISRLASASQEVASNSNLQPTHIVSSNDSGLTVSPKLLSCAGLSAPQLAVTVAEGKVTVSSAPDPLDEYGEDFCSALEKLDVNMDGLRILLKEEEYSLE